MLLLHYYASPGGEGVQRTRSYGRSGGANRKPRERAREHPSTGARRPAPTAPLLFQAPPGEGGGGGGASGAGEPPLTSLVAMAGGCPPHTSRSRTPMLVRARRSWSMKLTPVLYSVISPMRKPIMTHRPFSFSAPGTTGVAAAAAAAAFSGAGARGPGPTASSAGRW